MLKRETTTSPRSLHPEKCAAQQTPSLSHQLAAFFEHWPQPLILNSAVNQPVEIDVPALAHFFDSLSQPLDAMRQNAAFFDPWEVIKLGRKEVLNTAILAWMLNPRGSHGFGALALMALLGNVQTSKGEAFPADPGRYCHVRAESSPGGDSAQRVDIEIDAENVYLLIEAKIDAPEQHDQLARYCREAESRAGARPWAVIFLTSDGRPPLTGGEYRISCLSWQALAEFIEPTLRRHFRQQKVQSATRSAAELSVLRFLSHIRRF